MSKLRLGVLTSHPIQYQAPLFRELSQRVDLEVYFAHDQTAAGQAAAGFGTAFNWDVDLLDGYPHQFLRNVAKRPDVSRFSGCDTPEIREVVRSGNFDGFLVMGWYLKSYCQAIWECRSAGVPLLVRGDSRLGNRLPPLKALVKEIAYPWLMRQFAACLYVGQENLDYLRHYGAKDKDLFFSPHCVDSEWFAARSSVLDKATARTRLGIGPDELVVLFVGKLLATKLPDQLLTAAARLRERGRSVRVVFAGDGPLRDELIRMASALSVPVTMLGFRNQSELPAVYRTADLVALPSASETWGLVINEALSCGVPVVVSDAVGCARDLVDSGRTGATHRVSDEAALTAALSAVLDMPIDHTIIAAKVAEYSIEGAADGIVAALTAVSAGRNRRRRKDSP